MSDLEPAPMQQEYGQDSVAKMPRMEGTCGPLPTETGDACGDSHSLGPKEPTISEVAYGCVSGGILGQLGRCMPQAIDFKENGEQEGSLRSQIRLLKSPHYVVVVGTLDEQPSGSLSLVANHDQLKQCAN